jgi:hypothetical protein
MSDFDTDLINDAKDRGIILEKTKLTPFECFDLIRSKRSKLMDLKDIYELDDVIVEPYKSGINSLEVIRQSIPYEEYCNFVRSCIFVGDQLTDFAYRISIKENVIELISEIPQNNIIFSEDGRILVVLTFEGEIVVHRV